MGEHLTIWTVRLAVACYLGRYAVDVSPIEQTRRRNSSRWLWTIGCLLYIAHVGCAFAFFHDWSHTRAYEHTAAQTKEVVGWNWGGGLYFNYAFTLVWIVDTIGSWSSRERNRNLQIAAHLFLAFMVVNATVVFGPPFWKWVACGFLLAIALLYAIRRKRAV